ncbi:MAG: very short patch repair endonuclease [Candidatus Binataceae bacterium]
MTDVFSPAKRSEIMKSIKPQGNRSTELRLVSVFRRAGLTGWRRHVQLPGRPDFSFRKQRVAIFVDGDFWHGNPRRFRLPKTNRAFWREKIRYNRAKDKRVARLLRSQGWTVVRIWESTLRRQQDSCLKRVLRALEKSGA